jgi:hypothetical protein
MKRMLHKENGTRIEPDRADGTRIYSRQVVTIYFQKRL